MFCTLILAAALAAQTPATHAGPKTDAELRAMCAQINARVAANAAPWKPYTQPKSQGSIETYADRKALQRRQVAAMERAQERTQAEAARRYQIEARAQYERMLPYMLENQRQQYNRMSQMERNAIAQENAETYRRRTDQLTWWLMQHPAK